MVRTYIDRALSAKTDSRPQFQQMIHDSATHTFEAVLVWKLDRFSRNRYDSAHYKRILKNNRVHVVSVTEPISNTPEGIMLESLLEGMAEYYSAELAEKVSRGHKEKCHSRPSSTAARHAAGATRHQDSPTVKSIEHHRPPGIIDPSFDAPAPVGYRRNRDVPDHRADAEQGRAAEATRAQSTVTISAAPANAAVRRLAA